MACTTKSSVKMAPTSTTNMTGFFHWMSGRNMMNDCLSAARTNSGASKPSLRLRRGGRSRGRGDGTEGCVVARFPDVIVETPQCVEFD